MLGAIPGRLKSIEQIDLAVDILKDVLTKRMRTIVLYVLGKQTEMHFGGILE